MPPPPRSTRRCGRRRVVITRSARRTSSARCAISSTVRPSPRRVDRLADELRAGGVEVGGRLVEDHERRVAQERPRQRDAPRLARRQRPAAVADHACRSPSGSAATKPSAPASAAASRTRASSASASPRRMLSATVPRNSVGRCGTHASCARQAAASQRGEVDAADGDAPAGRLGQPQQQRRDRALARAARADERDRLARRELESSAVEHRRRPGAGSANETPSNRIARRTAGAGIALPAGHGGAAPRAGRAGARRPRSRRRSRGTARPGCAAAGTARARARAPSAPPRSRCRRRRAARRR